ncbi:UNVERIFIED_CONTAM: hypothetical protein HDU68_003328 [Siphonaria sp. JEL0065]|nr:hypothetical protein HDU68_003328 [Siphonaria sp. JEL0065]
MIVLTDGVSMSLMKGDFIYREVCRRLARDLVHVTVIQIGSTNGFYPEVNFGYVPDNEALRFLALAVFGKFIYSSDCKYLDPAVIGDTVETAVSLAVGTVPPNFYHRNILMRETHLQKSKHVELYRFVVGPERPVDTPRIRFINSNMEASVMPDADTENEYQEIVFPWHTESVPPTVGEILCGYKDYTVEAPDLAGLIHTRLLEGFAVKSIHGTGGSRKHGHTSSKPTDKVEIILMRPWLPNVTIQYTIKARFSSDSENEDRPFLSRAIEGKAPRIELNILAHHSFAINFVNIEGGAVKNERLLKLHNYLHGIHESDALVKILIAFNQKSVMSLIPKFDPRLFTSSIGSYGWGAAASTANQDQGNIWNVMCSFMINKATSFDDWDRDVVLRSSNPNRALTDVTSAYPSAVFNPRSSAKFSQVGEGSQGRSRLPSALIHIMNILATQWSSFAINRTTFVKFYPDDHSPTGLAVLRLVYETDWLMSIRMSFFNVPLDGRQRMGRRLCIDLGQLNVPCSYSKSDASSPGASYAPIRICSKPIRRMMLRYRFSSNEDLETVRRVDSTSSNPEQSMPFSITEVISRAEKSAITAHLISPVGPRSYLRSYRWIWLADVCLSDVTPINSGNLFGTASKSDNAIPVLSILDLAFYLLFFARLEDGYLLVSHLQDSVTMYREITVEKSVKVLSADGNVVNVDLKTGVLPLRQIVCGVQYVILVDRVQKTIVTELWVEPVLQGTGDPRIPPFSDDVDVLFKELHETISREIVETDARLFETLYTFDKIHSVGRNGQVPQDQERSRKFKRSNTPNSSTAVDAYNMAGNKVVEACEPGRKSAIMQTSYNIESALEKADFHCILYSPPRVVGSSAVNNGSVDETNPPSTFSPLLAVKSDGDLATSRGTSPNVLLDSPRGSISNDYIFNRRSSQAFLLGKSHSLAAVTKPVLSIGLNWDMLLACTPTARIRLLLFKFFQNSMNFVTDGEVTFTMAPRRKNSTFSTRSQDVQDVDIRYSTGLNENLLEKVRLVIAESFSKTEILATRIDETICYVKIRSPEQFILTFVPKVLNSAEMFKGSCFTVTMVQCNRAQVHSSSSGRERLAPVGFDRCASPVDSQVFNYNLQVKEVANESEIFADGTVIVKGDTGSTVGAAQTSDDEYDVASLEYVDNYIQSITAAYGNAHCQSVYAGLLQNVEIDPKDIEKALACCVEVLVEIDLTAYLNVLTLRHKVMTKDDIRLDKIDVLNSVRNALSKHFKQLAGISDLQNVYFYNPNDGADGCLTPSRMDCADSPLFIRTECTIRKGHLSKEEAFQAPAVAIPTSYVISDLSSWDIDSTGESMFPIDFTPHSIGTPDNPIQSVDGTAATLQIVCLCLIKPTKYDASYDDTIEVHEKELDDPRLILTREKVNALYATVEHIKDILDDEIMNGLLELPSRSEKFTLEFVKNCLSDRHKIPSNFGEGGINEVSTTCIWDFPLTFVHPLPNTDLVSAEFAKREFNKSCMTVQHLNEYFYVAVHGDWSVGREIFDKHHVQAMASISMNSYQGLGISLAADEYLARSIHADSSKKNCVLMSFKGDYARVWYFTRFTSPEERRNTLNWIQTAVHDTCNRISRLLLLQQLKQKHRASKLLIDRNANDDASDDEDEEDENRGIDSNLPTFQHNQFACPLVFSRQFSIHWRVKPSLALNAAVASITILAITNRKNMFVFEDGDTIVYFKVSIKEVEGEFSPVETSRMASVDEINMNMNVSIESIPGRDSPKTTSPVIQRSIKNTPSVHRSVESFLLLEFFGVDVPGPAITTPFVSMIESKLSSLTQREIGTYMSRNMKAVRLTPADVEFIFPLAKAPQRREFFKIPSFLDSPFKFILFLKQTLLTNLTSLPANDISKTLATYYEKTYGISYLDADLTTTNSQDINFGEFSFLYNSLLLRGASRFETSVGAGTAVVSIALLDERRKVIGTVTEPSITSETFVSGSSIFEVLRSNRDSLRLSDYDTCVHDDSALMLSVEIWSHGSVNGDCLMDFVFKCYCDSLLDYQAETSINRYTKTLLDYKPMSSISQLDIVKSLMGPSAANAINPSFGVFFDNILEHLKASAQLNNNIVEELSSPIKLPASIMDGLAVETRDLLLEASSAFNAVMISRQVNPSGSSDLGLYVPKASAKASEAGNRQILIVAGLQDLQDLYGAPTSTKTSPISSGTQTPTRHASISDVSSDDSSLRPSVRKNTGFTTDQAPASRRLEMDKIMCFPSTIISTSKAFGTRHGFFLMMIESNRISVATYNINKPSCEDLFNHILRILSWNNIRMQFLEHGFGFDNTRDPFRPQQYQQSAVKSTPGGVDYSSSYAGIGGLGHAAMKHFEKRSLSKENAPEHSEEDRLQQMYNINASSLQKSAVSLLDSYVRRIGSTAFLKSEAASQWSKTPDYLQGRSHQEEFLKSSKSHSNNCLDDEGILSPADLAAVLRSVRLHFVHYPIFFSSLRETLLNLDGKLPTEETIDAGLSGQDQSAELWFRAMLAKFSTDYAGYLTSLGFEALDKEVFKTKAADEWVSNPSFSVAKNLKIEVEPTYFVKHISGGVFILQIGVDGFCAAVNLYMLKYPTGPLNPFDEGMRYGAEKEIDKQFKQDCLFFKGSLHVHSCERPHDVQNLLLTIFTLCLVSYDFHIRYFQYILDNQPNCIVDVLDVMKTFEKYNSSRFVYARSRMLAGECLTDAQNLSASLFQYILKNPRIYGFKSLTHDGVPTACFLTSEYPDFTPAKHSQFEKGSFCYTVVIYMSRETSQISVSNVTEPSCTSEKEKNLRLRYFLLIIDRDNSFPLQGLDAKNQSFVNQSYSESLKEYLSGGCYLGDIAKFAEKKIEKLVEQAIRYYDRDSLWRQLYYNDHPTQCGTGDSDGSYEWTKMFLEKISPNSRCLLQMEPSLANLFGNPSLPWPQLISFLQTRFSKTCRQIYEEPKLGRKHVVFFNPKNSDYLIHFIYWKVDEAGLPQALNAGAVGGAESECGCEGEQASASDKPVSASTQRTSLNPMQRRMAEDDRVSVRARLRALETLGATLAKPGEYQIDILLVNREGLVDEVEYLHCNEVVNAICFCLWQ